MGVVIHFCFRKVGGGLTSILEGGEIGDLWQMEYTHLVLGRRTANFANAKKTFDSHLPEAVCNSPVLAVMTSWNF